MSVRVEFVGRSGGHFLVSEFGRMALNGLFCADVLLPLDLVPPLTDLTYKYQPAICLCVFVHQLRAPHSVVISYYSTHPLSVCLSVCRCVLSLISVCNHFMST